MMVMTLCLMVYGVSEYELQQSLQASNETIPDAMKKPGSTGIPGVCSEQAHIH